MTQRWPKLDYEADRPVIESLHAYLQVLGKLPTRAAPWCNHSWHLALRVVPRGFRSYPVEMDGGEAEIIFDCLSSAVAVETSTGFADGFEVTGQSVARFHEQFSELLSLAGVTTDVSGAPNEVETAVPFHEDTEERAWDEATLARIQRAFSDANRVFERFRTGFVGKSSPSHLFWGSFDLAVTRFSGREAPLHPGGFPNLPDRVTREAYSHEVSSAGFWLGGGGVEEAAFYAYGYPTPEGFAEATIEPDAAYWLEDLGEFVLPYEAVRSSADPEGALMKFLESTYAAVADAGGWAREAFEIPRGKYGEPYDVEAHREG
ncbi:hypothetical protein K3152_10005 [Qipengyuania sp. 1NDH17]|uniref:Ava_C0101 and related proteins n=1 Tax=Qipengyuania polymorpha TaxID=2867234 RepID=A0ABS7J1F6_9SPHN|nr:DUF5996 family protein [Qipengyuania polymorpha]MBX7458577.1 hypothetical protein [Qipengyuania polymorpha]